MIACTGGDGSLNTYCQVDATHVNGHFNSGAGGGGGWYGGGAGVSLSGSSPSAGGGSGYVNNSKIVANTGSLKGGNETFTAPGGGNETGHAGDGYARITRTA